MADSSATFISCRASGRPSASRASAAYRSPSAVAATRPGSRASAARTRGSSWPASATTSSRPGGATTAARTAFGICSAPPPRVAHRPDTTPPGTYSGWKRPSRTHCSRQAQPCAACNRASSRYRTNGSTTGCSCRRSSCRRVEVTGSPARRRAAQHVGLRVHVEAGLAEDVCRPPPRGPAARAAGPPPRRVGRRPRPEQLGQQRVVHLGAPRQAGVRHLDGGQARGGLRGDEQRRAPAAPRAGRGDPVELTGVRGRHALRGHRRRRPEPGSKARAAARGGAPAAPARAAVTAAAPAWSPSTAEQQRLGRGDVVAAADPDAGPDAGRGTPAATSARTQRGAASALASATAAARSRTRACGPAGTPAGAERQQLAALGAGGERHRGRALGAGSTPRSCPPVTDTTRDGGWSTREQLASLYLVSSN